MAAKRSPKKKSEDIVSVSVKKTVKKGKKSLDSGLNPVIEKINSLKKKKYFPYLLVLLILITAAYFGRSYLFAAMVGGKPITRVQLISELEKQAGQQALDSLITKELVSQEARRQGINITETEITGEIQRIEEILKAQGTTLEAALSMQGQTVNDLTDNIKLQKTVEKLLEDKLEVSDQEVTDYFEQNKQYYGEEINFEEIKESIEEQITQEKLSSEFQVLLQKLKNEGNIIYFVDFN